MFRQVIEMFRWISLIGLIITIIVVIRHRVPVNCIISIYMDEYESYDILSYQMECDQVQVNFVTVVCVMGFIGGFILFTIIAELFKYQKEKVDDDSKYTRLV